jgi:hypothetical protein
MGNAWDGTESMVWEVKEDSKTKEDGTTGAVE